MNHRLPHVFTRALVCIAACFQLAGAAAPPLDTPPAAADDGAIPQPFKTEVLGALGENSPFTRQITVSDSLILTGIAHMEGEIHATLLDTRTLQSQIVSRVPNFHGWQLVGVQGDPARVQTWTARVQFPGGEVVSIRYQKPPAIRASKGKTSSGSSGAGASSSGSTKLSDTQVQEARQAAVNYKEGFTSDGYPKAPPPEMVQKLSRLSTNQREEINREMIGHRNRGLGLDERRKIYEGLVDRAMQRR